MSADEIRANNLQSLLKFCLKADDGSKSTETDPAELKEKAEWFQKFVQETSVNYSQIMLDDIAILSAAVDDNSSSDTALAALDELYDLTEEAYLAKDFIKMGGLQVVRRVIEMDVDEMAKRASQLIGNVTQNDELNQTSAVNAGLVEFLLSRIISSPDSSYTKRFVSALSCCIRGLSLGVEKFKSADGFNIVLRAMGTGHNEATAKCAFLLFCTVSEDEQIRLLPSNLSNILATIIQFSSLSQDGLEHLLGLTKVVLQRDPAMIECFSRDIIDRLEAFIVEAADKDEFMDSAAHVSEILNECNKLRL